MDASQNPKTIKMMGLEIPQSEIEKILVQREAESFYGVFGPFFH